MGNGKNKDSAGAIGCFVTLLILFGIGYAAYAAYNYEWGCDRDNLSQYCARKALKDACSATREIEGIISVSYKPPSLATEHALATATYEFRMIPQVGQTAPSSLLRATSPLYFDDTDKLWLANCY